METKSFKTLLTDFKKVTLSSHPFRPLSESEVLVKILAAPINPADRMMAAGTYQIPGITDQPTAGVGFEGSGVITEVGHKKNTSLIGTTVGILSDPSPGSFQGTFREYIYLQVTEIVPFPEGIDASDVCSVTNPITTFPMMEQVKAGGHKAILMNAACSAVGKMVVRLCEDIGVKTVWVVRKEEQKGVLEDMGVEFVVSSGEDGFLEELEKVVGEVKPTLFFDAVGGELTTQIMNVMPQRSTISLIDGMSGEKVAFDPVDFIFRQNIFTSVHVTEWMKSQTPERMMEVVEEIASDLATGGKLYGTEIYKSFPLASFEEAFECSIKNASKGKAIIKPASS